MIRAAGAYHIPAMLHESLDALAINPAGIYVDATYGGGGHSKAILQKLNSKGRLISFDRDLDAQENLPQEKNFTLVHHDFIHLKNYLRHLEAIPADGILADLGISSHQIDTEGRGFSFRFDAPLDMRMDKQNPRSAKEIVNEESAEELQRIFGEYGEVKNARTLAQAIVRRRKIKQLETTLELTQAAEEVLPARENLKKYLAPVFQALRIAVNDELEGLKSFLQQCLEVLRPGGRLAVITYHSLEDRIVKQVLQGEEDRNTPNVYGGRQMAWKAISRKPIIPSDEEIANNPRVRSAKLRVAEKNP
jgi:16S rRNA (cytosine1402-N4)-methyltransferase